MLHYATVGSRDYTVRFLYDASDDPNLRPLRVHWLQVPRLDRQHLVRDVPAVFRFGPVRVLRHVLVDSIRGFVFHAQDDGEQHPSRDGIYRSETRNYGLGVCRFTVCEYVVCESDQVFVVLQLLPCKFV